MGGRRSRFLGRRAALAGGRLSPPPLTTPPPAPRSLLSPSWFPRSPPASGPTGDPRPGPHCCQSAGRGRPQVVPRSSSPQRPAQPWWREAGTSVTLKRREEGLPISIPIPKAGLQPQGRDVVKIQLEAQLLPPAPSL
ncbi:uncharacterized protein LOC117070134 isoform X2 [Trachypithecus francoisi]|uniref:uncharacterized protein LOC117070134 isoform X2 n=1 Tax=Trachypithecus francoisi TaxID=54180 RepID=UPI00141BA045|nr:uncharacterized protein LOC117070134 isoform X2 [Trachypithecus francoisi]